MFKLSLEERVNLLEAQHRAMTYLLLELSLLSISTGQISKVQFQDALKRARHSTMSNLGECTVAERVLLIELFDLFAHDSDFADIERIRKLAKEKQENRS
ncbi:MULTISPECIES: hypothetical protein [Glaesserella]|uniref:hypothetical protein n=1 Tax=Glaesserella TaxID=2094023 RepID=UPI00105760B1|nr:MULTISPECIES: hypothetical protein [Glaesserella]